MFLGVDLGTTNVKALVADSSGRVLRQGTCPIHLFQSAGGVVEQDLQEIWEAARSAIQQVTRTVEAGRIRAIGVSSQGGALQLLDRRRQPLGRIISWLDQRGDPFAEQLVAELGPKWFLERIAHTRPWVVAGQLLRLHALSPELLAAPNAAGFVGDLIVERLCSEAAHDGTSAGLTLLYDPVRRRYDPDLLACVGLQASQLPKLLPARCAAGGLLPNVAEALGLPAGIPVSAAIHDQYASALSTGSVEAGAVMVGTGTAWVLLAVCDALPAPVSNNALICHHVVDGLFGQIVSLVNGGSALTWALELMGHKGIDPDRIDQLIESAPPGSDGLVFWPFLTPFGASGLAPGTPGRLTGLQLSHRQPHLTRAVVEGLACELKRHLAVLERSGIAVRRLALAGGAASSRVTPQVLADVTGLPVACSDSAAGSAYGAAILARGLLEPQRSLADLSREMARPAREGAPGPNASFYARAYRSYVESLPLL